MPRKKWVNAAVEQGVITAADRTQIEQCGVSVEQVMQEAGLIDVSGKHTAHLTNPLIEVTPEAIAQARWYMELIAAHELCRNKRLTIPMAAIEETLESPSLPRPVDTTAMPPVWKALEIAAGTLCNPENAPRMAPLHR